MHSRQTMMGTDANLALSIPAPVRRRADGSVDIDFYVTRGRRLRAIAFANAARRCLQAASSLPRRACVAFARWRQRRRSHAVLSSLNDRTLADIGFRRRDLHDWCWRPEARG